MGIGGWLVMGHGLFVKWSLMGLNLHFTLKYHSLKQPLTSSTDVPMMEILDQSTGCNPVGSFLSGGGFTI